MAVRAAIGAFSLGPPDGLVGAAVPAVAGDASCDQARSSAACRAANSGCADGNVALMGARNPPSELVERLAGKLPNRLAKTKSVWLPYRAATMGVGAPRNSSAIHITAATEYPSLLAMRM